MNKRIYIVRHAEAEGQTPQASLTEKGFKQAKALCDFLADTKIDKVISSPYVRAVQTADPVVKMNNIVLEKDDRLKERVLSTQFFTDWMDKLEATFCNMELRYEGGESSNQAQNRIIEVIDEILTSDSENIMIVSHGGIISLLFNYYNKDFGFEDWKKLSNPDVYLLTASGHEYRFKRLWEE